MTPHQMLTLIDWLSTACLAGADEGALVSGFCRRIADAGIPIRRVFIGSDTLHPVVEGYSFEWHDHRQGIIRSEYGRDEWDDRANSWTLSPFYRLVEDRGTVLRCHICADESVGRYPIVAEMRELGMTDYLAHCTWFGESAAIGDMDALYSSWATDRPGGFADAHLAALTRLIPHLGLSFWGAAGCRIGSTLMRTYLGGDPGRRVLAGQIDRGVTETLRAVLWLSDLRGFTRIADTVPAEQLIPFLNDYQGCLVSAVHGAGGQVLKFMGDGLLAMFNIDEGAGPEDGCRRALDATDQAFHQVALLTARRAAEGLPVTGVYLGLHIGEVLYGNIGSQDRLDFTVVGPAVNEVSRIAGMCRSLDQDVVLSAAFAEAAGSQRQRLVALGRYALRGVSRPQALFTLEHDPLK